jgi:hypothetical protein
MCVRELLNPLRMLTRECVRPHVHHPGKTAHSFHSTLKGSLAESLTP